MEQQTLTQLLVKLFELGPVFVILSCIIYYFWNENKALKGSIKERDITIAEKNDFILQENKANFNVMVQSMNIMKELAEFLEAHKESSDITRKQQASILKLLKDKNHL